MRNGSEESSNRKRKRLDKVRTGDERGRGNDEAAEIVALGKGSQRDALCTAAQEHDVADVFAAAGARRVDRVRLQPPVHFRAELVHDGCGARGDGPRAGRIQRWWGGTAGR